MTNTTQSNEFVFWRIKKVESETGLKKSQLYSMIAQGLFPSPVRLGKRSSAWVSTEVDDWKIKRIKLSRGNSSKAA